MVETFSTTSILNWKCRKESIVLKKRGQYNIIIIHSPQNQMQDLSTSVRVTELFTNESMANRRFSISQIQSSSLYPNAWILEAAFWLVNGRGLGEQSCICWKLPDLLSAETSLREYSSTFIEFYSNISNFNKILLLKSNWVLGFFFSYVTLVTFWNYRKEVEINKLKSNNDKVIYYIIIYISLHRFLLL